MVESCTCDFIVAGQVDELVTICTHLTDRESVGSQRGLVVHSSPYDNEEIAYIECAFHHNPCPLLVHNLRAR